MKRIMIAACAITFAAFAQAASVAWSSNAMALTDAAGTAISALDSGSLVLVVMSTATGWDSAVEIPTGTGTGKTSLSISTRAASLGQISGTVNFTYTGGGTDMINNGDYLALMFKDTDGLHQLTYTSGVNAGEAVDAVLKVNGLASNITALKSQKIAMTGNFAAPEPTSAMLLLLGLAGLALKRKQA